ncbi:MAG: ribose-phosphate pyrophosphokinase [Kiritimatiellaeota bacterium]|nr:ribose-phosphate pyrophosphokinase [Kiritimatiellota bacterium]
MYSTVDLALFAGSANPDLAEGIAQYLGVSCGAVEIRRFSEGEVFVKFLQNIRGSDVFIVQPTCSPPNETLMELLIMLDAARRASAQRITAVLPFYGYARQDRKDQPRVPITAKLVANLLCTAGADRILTMDLHAQQIQGFFDIPVDHLYAAPVFVRYLRSVLLNEAVVVSPDVGSVKMAQAYGDLLGCGFAVVAKRRVSAEKVESAHLVGEVEGRDCILVDDLTTTAGTLIAAAEKLKSSGAQRVFAAVSHCCLTPEGHRGLDVSPITELVTTDSVPVAEEGRSRKVKVLSIAGLLGEAIHRIHAGESVSSLFRVAVQSSARSGPA